MKHRMREKRLFASHETGPCGRDSVESLFPPGVGEWLGGFGGWEGGGGGAATLYVQLFEGIIFSVVW